MSQDDDFEAFVRDNKGKYRDTNGRFAKGASGNPRGRPRTKHQRAASNRQYRRDILNVTEEMVPIKMGGKTRLVPFHIANLLSIRARAGQGHAPSQRYLNQLHREAIAEHERANPQLTKPLEAREEEAVNSGVDGLPRWKWLDLNRFRKLSWRL